MGMDQLSTVILLLIAFLAFYQGIAWIFLGLMVILILSSKSMGLSALFGLALALTWVLGSGELWLYVFILTAVLVMLAKRKENDAASMYSPELMKLLGGY